MVAGQLTPPMVVAGQYGTQGFVTFVDQAPVEVHVRVGAPTKRG